MMGRGDSAASAPLLEKTAAAAAAEAGGGYYYVEGCPGCAVDRHKAANPGIPYANFIYVWIVTLCTVHVQCNYLMQELCDAANEEVDENERVQIANFLCPVHLAVAGAFHTSFMQPAVSRLESVLAVTEIRTPRIPVISNVDAQPHSDPDTIKQILAQQVLSNEDELC